MIICEIGVNLGGESFGSVGGRCWRGNRERNCGS